ncbi:MAG: hypothetical protein SFX19_04165 [Alphaproteobacteria bacterium]|nr:hypothetical protein [Alphaproteobacteria bacterium]
MVDWQQRHLEEVMSADDFPARVRKYFLEAMLYTLREMPKDVHEQRRVMLEQDDGHFPDGRPTNYRTAKFANLLEPGFVSFPRRAEFSTSTTHQCGYPEGGVSYASAATMHLLAEPAENYLNDRGGGIINLGIRLSGDWLGEADSEKPEYSKLIASLRLEKFLRHIAETAGFIEKSHNVVPRGEFGIDSFYQGDDCHCSLQFHTNDYAKLEDTLKKMIAEVQPKVEAEAAQDPTQQVLFKLGITPKDGGLKME